jgi:single-strand DNA-binding protein
MGDITLRTLPSGDTLAVLRLVLPRDSRRPRRAAVDSRAVARLAALRRTLTSCGPGDELELQGELRRPFWWAAGGSVSRCEVEVRALRGRPRDGPG